MDIRTATIDDLAEIQNIAKSLTHFYLKNETAQLPEWFENTLTDEQFLIRLKSPDFSNYVYEIKGQLIGYISMKGLSHLYHLFILENHQRRGYSRKLWEFATKQCISDIYTLRSSLYAVPVYKKLGFIEVGPTIEKDGIDFQAMELHT